VTAPQLEIAAGKPGGRSLERGGVDWSWAIALAGFVLLWQFGGAAKWAVAYPPELQIPAARWIGRAMRWLTDEAGFGFITFTDVTRFLAALIDVPYRIVLNLLSKGLGSGEGSDVAYAVPPLSWVAVVVIAALLGHRFGGWRLAALAGGCFIYLALFRQWDSAMVTLASILVAVPIGVGVGLLLGIAAHRWPAIDQLVTPILDLMQTIPVFAYLVPILILFGFGPTAAVVATLIYAMPPMTRITTMALRGVPSDVLDLGRMIGCSRRQMTWRIMVPSVRDSLMVGVNQVIMLSLNMVIIASMIGAGGLGFDVLAALRRLDIGAGLEAGLAIVALAIALDRLSQAAAVQGWSRPVGGGFVRRHGYLIGALTTVVVTALLGLGWPAVQAYPEHLSLSTGSFWAEVVRWININYFDTLEAFKTVVVLNVLVPVKRALGGLPWAGVVGLLAFAGWRLGGFRLALTTGGLSFLIAATGQWEKAVITVYLCGISIVIAALLGIPLGIVTAERARLWRWVQAVLDTLQTLPSFVYLMPAVMLFRVGDFTALLAVVAYSIVPAIRYTALGLQIVDPRTIEAGRAMGCTSWQLLTKIKLKLALPEIMLGINQTLMFALSMLVITALVGTRDLGQEVYIALTKADPGRGLVAGLAVAFIAIIADRMISAGAARTKARLGLA
jgi:glycine betaine/proline transport system permease protein